MHQKQTRFLGLPRWLLRGLDTFFSRKRLMKRTQAFQTRQRQSVQAVEASGSTPGFTGCTSNDVKQTEKGQFRQKASTLFVGL